MHRFLSVAFMSSAAFIAGSWPVHADVRIGFHAPTTGFAAADGASAQIAAELAVEDLNKAGGIAGEKVELISYDDQAQPQQSIAIANKLINQDGVSFAISGSYSEPTRAAATIFQEGGIPYIAAYATHPAITQAGDQVFRPFKLGPQQATSAAHFIAENLKLKKVTAIIVDNDYGQTAIGGFQQAVQDLDLDLINTYTFGMKDRQFGSIVASVKRDNPDAIFVAGYFFHGGPLAIQLRAAGITAPIIGTQGFDSDSLISIAGQAAEGVYVINGLNRDNQDASFQHLMEALKAKGAESPSVAAAVYSAFMLLNDASKRANSTDPSKVRNALQSTKDFPHFYGALAAFSPEREAQLPTPVIEVKKGKFVFVTDIAN
ncbi:MULTISPECIES: ABC transporter substrate-binding protein [unclassified Rhizobium]|uniref:ABC transporter substrate-binding protein n=1 Tax=unclassified Rhizobium TaxID=2613769 RepID=UPI000BC916C6|nr:MULTISPECIES: ABC transporter substrate-binding protein [unclassified Rhizobium]MDH7809623.1 branched-chain amino acid transport system substrate-binding protein [Rhizobium sp. AN67]SOD50190.1 branched-chain amino acid transport system substrate-binding protein [Rhizobium sp. AN6A]